MVSFVAYDNYRIVQRFSKETTILQSVGASPVVSVPTGFGNQTTLTIPRSPCHAPYCMRSASGTNCGPRMANVAEAKNTRVCRRLLKKLWRLQVSGILQPHGFFRSVTRRYAVAFHWSVMGSAEIYHESYPYSSFPCLISSGSPDGERWWSDSQCWSFTRGATSIYRTVRTQPSY